jgi:hypothetical protein
MTMRRFLFWLVLDSGVRLGRLAPWVFGLAMGRWPRRVK